ncbi:MAG: ABC transporter ATP-binding protein/permease [Planctomycetaceae bacterium]|nr:ABC transporter ATP-binding protein/permease [Planctomycetaceae bacterium]
MGKELREPSLEVKKYSLREIAHRMWPLVRPHRWRLLFASSVITACAVAVAAGPIFTKYVIDVAIPQKSLALAAGAMALFLVMQLSRNGLWYISQKIIIRDQEAVVFKLRSISFRHIQRLCLRFHGRFPSGFLHDRVFVQCIVRIGVMVSFIFSNMAIHITSLVIALAMCAWLSIPMTGVILLGTAAYVIVAKAMGPRLREQTIECNDAHNYVCGYILDKLQGNKTIQAHALEDRIDMDFDRQIWSVQEKFIRARVEQTRLGLMSSSLSFTITAAIHVLGAYYVFQWGMTTGTLVAFITYQAIFVNVITSLTDVYGQIVSARTGFDQLFSVLDTQSSVRDRPTCVLPPRLTGRTEFDDVMFAYQDKPVLSGVSFCVQPGQTVALVGRSGAGKSTITNLLLRFYDPNVGRIAIDGQDIKGFSLRQYRSRFGVVLQEPFLFDATIEDNLKCVRPQAAQADVRRALEMACAMEFVEQLPGGLAYRVGERGGALSGGQRQRLAIARTLLLNPDLLILDEATSALDNESEALVQKALQAVFQNRTTFVIAHRLSTIRSADRILVFDAGRLVEDGNYKGLMACRGLFHHLHTVATSTSGRQFKIEEAGFA